jgi:predicted DNA binding protein
VLEAAFFAGYFEWPRDVSGEDLAESLGVSSPTFHQHLRNAQRKLLDAVLGEGATG